MSRVCPGWNGCQGTRTRTRTVVGVCDVMNSIPVLTYLPTYLTVQQPFDDVQSLDLGVNLPGSPSRTPRCPSTLALR